MQRFFVDPAILQTPEVTLRGEIAHQISRVLRMRPGDEVILLDGEGNEYPVRLTGVDRDAVLGSVLQKRRVEGGEPAVQVDPYLSLLNKPDKFEWALQKCTELG